MYYLVYNSLKYHLADLRNEREDASSVEIVRLSQAFAAQMKGTFVRLVYFF